VRLGETEEAKAVALRFLEFQPSFNIARQCAAVGTVPPLAAALTQAVCSAGWRLSPLKLRECFRLI